MLHRGRMAGLVKVHRGTRPGSERQVRAETVEKFYNPRYRLFGWSSISADRVCWGHLHRFDPRSAGLDGCKRVWLRTFGATATTSCQYEIMIATDWKSNLGPNFSTQTFAVGDVHGQADALSELLDHIDEMPRTHEKREVIFTGDLIDRGPSSLRSMKLAVEAASRFDECNWLPGNHELVMAKCLSGKATRDEIAAWYAMGGHETLTEVSTDPYSEDSFQLLRDAVPDVFRDAIFKGPTHLVRNGVLFVHAGLDPNSDAKEFLARDRFKSESYIFNHWSCIRYRFLKWENDWERLGFKLVVHGHTPATNRPVKNCQEAEDLFDLVESHRRINVDAGAMSLAQVAAVEFSGTNHRIHVRPAPVDIEVLDKLANK